MNLKPISLQDKDLFNEYLAGCANRTALYNFTSLFIWRGWGGGTFWRVSEGALCVYKQIKDQTFNLPPISADENKAAAAVEELLAQSQKSSQPLVFYEVTEELLAFFSRRWPGKFEIKENRNGSNYIYNTADLISLSGKPYAAKRNHINSFVREHAGHALLPLTPALIPQCREYMREWLDSRGKEKNPALFAEFEGTMLALESFGHLDYQGACLMSGREMFGFTIGEALNKDTVVIHIEKATAAVNGAYPLINQLFLRQFWQEFPFVNRCEDMGDPGLRKAKLSYHPCRMETVYTLRFPKGS
ncbi:MAG: phosphatidylglycerol lysyltransferase domain-containing protein [Clostridiales bacterium]|nr:phosphatidylglycerol lysyltransferase domain-containing protein [Clostridiales bacterium]